MNGSSSNTTGASVISLHFANAAGADKIADDIMAEVARRLIATLEAGDQGNVVFSPTEPADKTKAWWQTDPVTGIPIGQPKTWSEAQGAWVAISAAVSAYVPPAKRNGTLVSATGASTLNFNFEDIQTTDYRVTLTPTTYDGAGFDVAPATIPTTMQAIVISKSNTQVTVSFTGIPTEGLTWEIDVEAR